MAAHPVLPRGPFRGSAAIAAGLVRPSQLRGAVCQRMLPDVYLRRGAPLDHIVWCQAALLIAPPGSVLGYRSALSLYCPMLRLGCDEPVDLIIPSWKSMRKGARVHPHRAVLRADEIGSVGGFPVTNPTRTAFDLARDPDITEAVVCLDALLGTRRTTHGAIAPYTKLGVPGSRHAERALALADPGAESPMETRTRMLLVRGGLPKPVVQHRVYRDGRFIARLDLAYPHRRLGIEYDGDHHREVGAFRHDAIRGNELLLAGWTVLRFTADDVLRHPGRMLYQVRERLGL